MLRRDRCKIASTWAAAIVACLPVLAAASRELQSPELSGTAVLVARDLHGGGDERIASLVTQQGRRVMLTLRDPSQLEGVFTGMPIRVIGQWENPGISAVAGRASNGAPGGIPRFIAEQIIVRTPDTIRPVEGSQPPEGEIAIPLPAETTPIAAALVEPAAPTYTTQRLLTASVSTVVIPIVGITATNYGGYSRAGATTCTGLGPAPTTVGAVRSTVFQELNPGAITVGSTFNDCSFDKTRLNTSNSFVSGFVHLPCSGVSYGVPWQFQTCEFDDFIGMADEADRVLSEEREFNLDKYKHRVYLLPPGPCSEKFIGMGYIGCDGSFVCRVWLTGGEWQKPQVYVHELSHNLYLQHAARLNTDGSLNEYGDGTCWMGYSPPNRCPNTPHAWQLGWVTLQQLNAASLPPGSTFRAQLGAQARWGGGLRIVPNWASGFEPLFLGYRNRIDGDAELELDYHNKVHIYSSPIAHNKDARITTLRFSLAPNGVWSFPALGLWVRRLPNATPNVAVVSICRRGGPENAETCAAGVDNDCNGLAGLADGACQALPGK